MAVFKCKMCGGDLHITEGMTVCECEYCGSVQTVPQLDDEKKIAEQPAGAGWGAGSGAQDPGSGESGSGAGRPAADAAAAGGQPGAGKPVRKVYPKAIPEDVKDIVRNWTKYISQLPPGMTRVSLMQAKHSVGDRGQLVIVFSNYVTADHFLHDEGYRNRLRYFLRQCSGKDVEIEYKALDKGSKFTDNYVDLSDIVRMEIEEE